MTEISKMPTRNKNRNFGKLEMLDETFLFGLNLKLYFEDRSFWSITSSHLKFSLFIETIWISSSKTLVQIASIPAFCELEMNVCVQLTNNAQKDTLDIILRATCYLISG